MGAVNEQLVREGKEPIDEGNAQPNPYAHATGAPGSSLRTRDQFAQTPDEVIEW